MCHGARELARTGEFSEWYAVEVYLRHEEGCLEARHVLDNERIRNELDRLCEEAHSKPTA